MGWPRASASEPHRAVAAGRRGPLIHGPKKDKLDSIIRVVTPENIGFEYRIAGPFRRLPAFAIDFAIIIAIGSLIFFVFALGLGFLSPGMAQFAIFG